MEQARQRLVRFMKRIAAFEPSTNPIGAFRKGVPTPWEHFRYSPMQWIVQRTYKSYAAATGTARPNQIDPVIRVVCISDTHNAHHRLPPLPKGDILIHAGDLTNTGSTAEIDNALRWLAAQPHRHKVFIAGNHDTLLASPSARDDIRARYPSLVYLQDSSVTLKLRGRKVKVYGTPRTPWRGDRGVFQYERRFDGRWMEAIPASTDILVTHGPPQFHGDVAGIGCNYLRFELWRVRPLLHVFGHIHAGRGVERATWSSVQHSYEGLCKRREGFGWMAALRVVSAALRKLVVGAHGDRPLTTRDRTESLLVNASSVGAAWDRKLLEPVVVEVALPSAREKRRRSRSLRK